MATYRSRRKKSSEIVVEGKLVAEVLGSFRGDLAIQPTKIRLGKVLAQRIGRRMGRFFLRARCKDTKGKFHRLELAESSSPEAQPSAHPPQVFEGFADSTAEDAESAEGVSDPQAREQSPGTNTAEEIDVAAPPTGDDSPHSPHSPHADSNSARNRGESAAEDCEPPTNPPRCRRCGTRMSVVAVSDRCGRCQLTSGRR